MMSAKYAFEGPSTLFKLSPPVDSKDGQIRAGVGFTFNGSRKRKRTEIAVGVDGESVNIFNIKTSSIRATHPIPPHCYLTCPPTIVDSKKRAQRFTYASLRNELDASRYQLLCFSREEVSTVVGVDDRVVHIEPLPNCEDSSPESLHDLLVVFENGNISVRSGDLKEEKWKWRLLDESSSFTVEYVNLHSARVAIRQGVLKKRHDLVAALDPTGTASSRSQVLLITTNLRRIHLVALLPRASRNSRSSPVLPLTSWTLPLEQPQGKQYAFEPATSMFFHLSDGIVSVHDLSLPTKAPDITSQLRFSNISHLLPLTSSMVAISSKTQCALYDAKYGSLQASTDLSKMFGRKRKRLEPLLPHGPLQLIAYFAQLGITVGIMGREVVACRTIVPRNANTLIDSLGKTLLHSSSNKDRDIKELANLAKTRKASAFDSRFSEIILERRSESSFRDVELQELCILGLGFIFDWNNHRRSDRHSVQASAIKIVFMPLETFNLITRSGHLLPHNITKALFRTRDALGNYPEVTAVDLVAAIADFDSTLTGLSTLVMDTDSLSLHGQVACLKLLINSFDQAAFSFEQGVNDAAEDGAIESEVHAEEEAAAQDLRIATSRLEHGVDGRAAVLRACLQRLGASPPSDLVWELRRQCSPREIILVIALLRLELSHGGWTLRMVDFHPSESHSGGDDAVVVIGKLLNCALDALGAAGWLADPVGPTLISHLREDTSSVLEGLQESSFFTGFLKDLIRYEETLKSHSPPHGHHFGLSGNMLPLGLKPARGIPRVRIAAGGEIRKRSTREVGQKLSQQVGDYKFETIRL